MNVDVLQSIEQNMFGSTESNNNLTKPKKKKRKIKVKKIVHKKIEKVLDIHNLKDLPPVDDKNNIGDNINTINNRYYLSNAENLENPPTKQVKTYPNGAKYEGPLVNGKAEGLGTKEYPIGKTFHGNFKNDLREGKGVSFCVDGTHSECTYENDLPEGHGICYSPEEIPYECEYHKGQIIKGKGIMYYGFYCEGKTYKDLSRYEGEYKNNMRDGQGIMVSPEGKKYEGIWKDDEVVSGCGIKYYGEGSNQSRYEGSFKNGKREGNGIMISPEGVKYEGVWKNNDIISGSGIMYYGYNLYDDKFRYEGEFKNGVRKGYGKLYNDNKLIFEGEWTKDKYNGEGVYYEENGDKYFGVFINSSKEGNGILYKSNGEIVLGVWKNNILTGDK